MIEIVTKKKELEKIEMLIVMDGFTRSQSEFKIDKENNVMKITPYQTVRCSHSCLDAA